MQYRCSPLARGPEPQQMSNPFFRFSPSLEPTCVTRDMFSIIDRAPTIVRSSARVVHSGVSWSKALERLGETDLERALKTNARFWRDA